MACYNKTTMNILTQFAQGYYSYPERNYDSLNSGEVGLLVGLYLFMLLLGIALYVVTALCLMKIFKKAGVKPWIAWVPFYNNWKLLEIGGQQGFWAVLAIIPVVSLVSAVFMYISMYHVGKKLGKDGAFVLLAIFFPYVWFIWLAVDKSTWNDSASTAPSLA